MTREEAIKCVDHLMYSSPHESTEQVVKKKYYAEKLIDYLANTVDIVRCKDCIYKQGSCCTKFAEVWLADNDFCSRSERKTE